MEIYEKNAPEHQYVIAEADSGIRITAQQFFEMVKASPIQAAGGWVEPSTSRFLLDSLLIDTLKGLEADLIPLEQHKVEYWTYRYRYQDVLVGAYIRERVAKHIPDNSASVIKFFHDHRDLFKHEEQVEIYHIMSTGDAFLFGPDSLSFRQLSPEKLEDTVRAHIFEAYRKLQAGEPFDKVVAEYSHDDITKLDGGYLRWVPRNRYHWPFDSVAFELKGGGYSAPYRDKDAWHIVKVRGYLPQDSMPLDQSFGYEAVQGRLAAHFRDSLARPIIDSLQNARKLVINDSLLDKDPNTVEDFAWYGIVNETDTVDARQLRSVETNLRMRGTKVTPEMRREATERLANRWVVTQAALAARLDTLPDVARQNRQFRHETARELLERLIYADIHWAPSEQQIVAYYQANRSKFHTERPIVVQQILTNDSVFAEFLRDQAMAGANFLDLARMYYPGDSTVRLALADLGAIGPNDVDSAFYVAADRTPVGQVSMPVKSKYGFHIIKVLEKKYNRTLEQARPEIEGTLLNEHRAKVRAEFHQKLFKKFHVKYPNPIGRMHLRPYPDRLDPVLP